MSEEEIVSKFEGFPEMQDMFRSAMHSYLAWATEQLPKHKKPRGYVSALAFAGINGYDLAIDECRANLLKIANGV